MFYDVSNFFFFKSFAFNQSFCNQMEFIHIFVEQFFSCSISIVQERAYFLIDFSSNFFTVIFITSNVTTQEYLVLTMTEGYRTNFFAHAIFTNHLTSKSSSTLQVIACAAGDFFKYQSFRYATAKQYFQFVQHFATSCIVTIFLRQAQGVATCTTTRNNSYFMYRISMFKEHTYDSMTAFVVSSEAFFVIADNTALTFRSHDNAFSSFFHFRHIDFLLVFTGSHQSSFVHQVTQVCTGKTRSALSNDFQFYIISNGFAFNMNFQNFSTTFNIRTVYYDLTVKATRTEQSRIQNIRTVSSSNHNDAFVSTEAIHFNQQLVQGLFAFIMTAT